MDGIFTVKIDMGNDAMQTKRDLAEALHNLANRVAKGEDFSFYRNIIDENGNIVGRARLISNEGRE